MTALLPAIANSTAARPTVGLLDIGLGRNVACRPLEVISHGPVAPAAELRAYQVGDHWSNPTQLRMAEGVL
jgi:hypothetical protein